MNLFTDPAAQRLHHYQGERLLAADLQDEQSNITRLRDLHVVALHDTWGIALGFEAWVETTTSVAIALGFGYDAFGRELLLTRQRSLAGPQQAMPGQADGDYVLVMSYDEALGRCLPGGGAAPCAGTNAPPGYEAPAFAWRPPDAVRLGRELPLLRVTVAAGAITASSPDVRRYAQPLTRPHIASGLTPPEQPWRPWLQPNGERYLGCEIAVDTSEGGFVGTPHYFTELRLSDTTLAAGGITAATFRQEELINQLFTLVTETTPAGFIFRVVAAAADIGLFFGLAQRRTPCQGLGWQVAWTGVESAAGCPPAIFRLFRMLPQLAFVNLERGPL